MYRGDNCSGISQSQFDEEAVECMYERGFNFRGLEDRVHCVVMEGEGRSSRSGEAKEHYASESCHEGAGEYSGREYAAITAFMCHGIESTSFCNSTGGMRHHASMRKSINSHLFDGGRKCCLVVPECPINARSGSDLLTEKAVTYG